MRKLILLPIVLGLELILYLWLGVTTASAQPAPPPRCEDVLNVYNGIVRRWHCIEVSENTACYGNALVQVEPSSTSFRTAGHQIAFSRFDRLETVTSGSQRGAALLVADSSRGQVKIYAIGNTDVMRGASPSVFTMYRTNGQNVCERTPSGFLVQTETRRQGRVTVNGVTIDLGSTAYINIEGDLMFDQDPRIDRRQGGRNPNAPLCSGFDSECNFGNCMVNGRLVWGPYCREDAYPYIRTGLYRVTLYGHGQVTAGATDYGATGKMFSIMAEDMTLPGSYTFCWNGLRSGGTGFETIVLARSANARVDHLQLEYLGADCNTVNRLGSATPDLMTVTNVEGSVTVTANGVSRSPRPGEEVRVHFVGGLPRTIDPPVRSTALPLSPLVEQLSVEVLPRVNGGYASINPTAPPPPTQRPTEPPTVYPSEPPPVTIRCGPEYVEIDEGECAVLWWDVEHVRAVYFDGQGVVGQDQRSVCPGASRRYELRVVTDTGTEFCHMDVAVRPRESYPPTVQDYPPIIGDVWYKNLNDPDLTIMDIEVTACVNDDFGVREVMAQLFFDEDRYNSYTEPRVVIPMSPVGRCVYEGTVRGPYREYLQFTNFRVVAVDTANQQSMTNVMSMEIE